MKYMKLFSTANEYTNSTIADYPNVSYVSGTGDVHYTKENPNPGGGSGTTPSSYADMPLTFQFLESGTFVVPWLCYASKNNGSSQFNSGSQITIGVSANDTIELWSTNFISTSSSMAVGYGGYDSFSQQNLALSFTAKCNVYGNLASLQLGNPPTGSFTYSSSTFRGLFAFQPIVSAQNLVFPSVNTSTLDQNNFNVMFLYCQYLTSVTLPFAPASSSNYIMSDMFGGITTSGTLYTTSAYLSAWQQSSIKPSNWSVSVIS